jgi:hypothetical protein
MAITYRLHEWPSGETYINLADAKTSRIRIKKLRDGDEIKNLDHNLATVDIPSLSAADFQKIVDDLIDRDEAEDAKIIERANRVIPDVDLAKSNSLRGLVLKPRTGPEVPPTDT